jgi:hypothetical protein
MINKDTIDDFHDRVKARFATLPTLHHIPAFLTMLIDAGLSLEDNPTPKQLIRKVRVLYPDLSLIEAFNAMKKLSSGAHIANARTDPRTYGLFQSAFWSHQTHTKSKREIPRLVILHSDMPALSASISCDGVQTVYATTCALELLDDKELRASLGHELGHIERDLKGPLWATLPVNKVKHSVTRNATRRRMEYAADKHAVDINNDPEALMSGMKKMQDYVHQYLRPMKDQLDEFVAELRARNEKSSSMVAWVLEKKGVTIEEFLSQSDKRTTWCERLKAAPGYPTRLEREDSILGYAAEKRGAPSPG